MNYLAHAVLSFGHNEILIGNMISDFVKGSSKYSYAPMILHGINLHRMIDTFTDRHPATKAANMVFRKVAGPYAGAFTDVSYDHFLATDPTIFSGESLTAFAARTYDVLEAHYAVLPERFKNMLPFMRNQNWLLNYSNHDGIRSSFGGVFRRAKYLEHNEGVFRQFMEHYDELQQYYSQFFPELYAYALHELRKMTEGNIAL